MTVISMLALRFLLQTAVPPGVAAQMTNLYWLIGGATVVVAGVLAIVVWQRRLLPPEERARIETKERAASKAAEAGQLKALLSLIAIGGLVWYFFLGGLERQTASTMQGIHHQVATDFAERYAIAQRSGSAMDTCVAAGLAAAGALQAKDEPAYSRWKAVEKVDCDRAGVSR